MKYIGNILTNTKFNGGSLYNVTDVKENLIPDIPTLVIGWDFTKKMFKNANILDWVIENGIYWTFGKRERRNKYENNLLKFKNIAIDKIIKQVDYEFFNVLTLDDGIKRDFFELLSSDVGKRVFIHNDMVYVWFVGEKKVFGLSLRDIEYNGKSRKNFLSMLYRGRNVTFVNLNDIESDDIKLQIRNCYYVLPFLIG